MVNRLAAIVNANLETCALRRGLTHSLCERLVQWIDDCVAAHHATASTASSTAASTASSTAASTASSAASSTTSTALPEHFVEDVLLVVNQMSQKETFEALYRAMLFQHLVTCQFGGSPSRVDHDVLLPEEMQIIDEIKAVCGNVFVSRMDSLAKDSMASREFTAYLRQQPSGVQLLQHCQFHVVSKGWGMGGV